MSVSTPIRTGIIGFGLSGRIFHGPFLATNPRFRVDLISTSDPERREQAAALHPGALVVSTAEDLLARAPDLDLVVLASPAHVHLEQGLTALAAGAAVVVDKPFAASVAEAEQLIRAAEAVGRPLMVFQNRRWDADFLTLRALLADGALGTVHRFESTFERWSPELRDRWQDTTTPNQGAGITFDLGSHLIDQALQLFGPAIVDHAELSLLRSGGVSDDEAFISLRHDGGVRSHLTLSRCAAQNAPRFRVLGSESSFSVHGLDGQELSLVAGMLPDDADYGVEPEARWGTLGITGSPSAPLASVTSKRGQYPAFYAGVAAALCDGAATPVDPRDALETLRIIERVHTLARG